MSKEVVQSVVRQVLHRLHQLFNMYRLPQVQIPGGSATDCTVGLYNRTSPLYAFNLSTFREVMSVNLEANFPKSCTKKQGNMNAYRATIPYLLSQQHVESTWTLATGGSGDIGTPGVSAVSQSALLSLTNVACYELFDTNIRSNGGYLFHRAVYDAVFDEMGTEDRIRASDYARVYERILQGAGIDACRVSGFVSQDILEPKIKKNWATLLT